LKTVLKSIYKYSPKSLFGLSLKVCCKIRREEIEKTIMKEEEIRKKKGGKKKEAHLPRSSSQPK
jgi:hypothetical protein